MNEVARYRITFEGDDTSGYCARQLEWPRCEASGATLDEAKEAISEAIIRHHEIMSESRLPPEAESPVVAEMILEVSSEMRNDFVSEGEYENVYSARFAPE